MAHRGKGTWAETKSVGYFQHSGFPYADRIPRSGAKDRGDVALCPGVISETKNCAKLDLPKWFAELEAEIGHAKAKHGFLTIKPKGIGDTRIGEWWAGMRMQEFSDLYAEAGDPPLIPSPVWLPGHRYKAALPREIAALSRYQEFGYVGVQPVGVENVADWYAMTQLGQIVRLLRLAGYGNEVLS